MKSLILPSIWLIVFIVGLPQLSETVYTPSLPDIASAFCTSDSMVEYTLTIYLFGFAIGNLFWGKISDQFGRKLCVLAGLVIFIGGCFGCYHASSIYMLLVFRLIQAFGGSIGSVLGQAICRDAFQGPGLGKAYASIGSALAFFPAIGPVIGGVIAERLGWVNIFLFLIVCAVLLIGLVYRYLPETHLVENRKVNSILQISAQLLRDRTVLGCGYIVAVCNGIYFSYFAEGSFCLIKLLGLSPSQYGSSFILIAVGSALGGIYCRKLNNHMASVDIILRGIRIMLGFVIFLNMIVLTDGFIDPLSQSVIIGGIILAQLGIMFGFALAASSSLSIALVDYKWCIGTASSILGCFYYVLISLITFGMGLLHNGTLLPMPLYFLVTVVSMLYVYKITMCRHLST